MSVVSSICVFFIMQKMISGCSCGKVNYRKDDLLTKAESNGSLSPGLDIIINNGGFNQIGGTSYGGGVSNGQGNSNNGGGSVDFGSQISTNFERIVQWFPDCDFPGHDISNQPSSEEDCSSICFANFKCNAFSWRDGNCYLKNIPSPNLREPVKGGLCGFLPWKFWFNLKRLNVSDRRHCCTP